MGDFFDKNLSTDLPLASFKNRDQYRNCDTHPTKAEYAATVTINTWLLAYEILSARNIPVLFILQPTSHIGTEFHQLDYLLNSEKQRIMNEKPSYEAQYAMIRKLWYEKCVSFNACDSFIDLSNIFNSHNEPIFIDSLHVSPNGNEIVAQAIYHYMCNNKQYSATHCM